MKLCNNPGCYCPAEPNSDRCGHSGCREKVDPELIAEKKRLEAEDGDSN